MRLQVLGPVRIFRDDASESGSLISQPRRLALLAYLSLARPRGLHSRDSLVAVLWPESDRDAGRHALRTALHAIRKTLGVPVFVTEGDGLVGIDRTILSCDAVELEESLGGGRDGLPASVHSGRLMEGFHVSGAPGFEEWMATEQRRFDELALSATWSLSESLERRGRAEEALAAARRACELAPYDERSVRRLIELLDRQGELAAAVDVYRQFAARLERELGLSPSAMTEKLLGGIRDRRQRTVARPSETNARAAPAGTRAVPTSDSTSYIHYVRGTYLFLRAAHGGPLEDFERSRTLFEEALARDPGFALAYAGLSNYYAAAAARNILRPFDAAFGRAIELSRRALELDPSLAIPHVHFGVKAMYLEGAWQEAGRQFARAVSLDPSYAEARRFLGIWHDVMGHEREALAELREAVRLEPQIAMFRNSLAAALMDREDWQGAMGELEQALELDPTYRAARERLVRCAEELGLFDVALAERSREPAIGPVDRFRRALDRDGTTGYRRIAREELRSLIPALEARTRTHPPANAGDLFNPPELRLAVIHARLGERDAARRWEEIACRARPGLRPQFRARLELQGSSRERSVPDAIGG